VKLEDDLTLVSGILTNNTGHDLRMVYLVVNQPHAEVLSGANGEEYRPLDLVLYVSFWAKGANISLNKQFDNPKTGGGATRIASGKDLINSSSIRRHLSGADQAR